MGPEEAESLADEDAADRVVLHYYTGHYIRVGAHGLRSDPHRFVVRAPTEWQAEELVRKEMDLSARDDVHVDQAIGFDDA